MSSLPFFFTPVVNDWGETTYQPTTAGFTAMILIMVAVFLAGVALFGKQRKSSTKQLTFSALAIALATVTSMIKLIHMPMGGSVTLLSMLFIVLVGYWYGLGAGLTAAFTYGVLQMVIDPYILTIPQALVDYIFAFTALGLSGLFSKQKHGLLKGYIVAVLARYFFAFLSGWIFFGAYAADYGFKSGVIYSLAYNGAYLGAEAAITIVVILIPVVAHALAQVKKMAVE